MKIDVAASQAAIIFHFPPETPDATFGMQNLDTVFRFPRVSITGTVGAFGNEILRGQ